MAKFLAIYANACCHFFHPSQRPICNERRYEEAEYSPRYKDQCSQTVHIYYANCEENTNPIEAFVTDADPRCCTTKSKPRKHTQYPT